MDNIKWFDSYRGKKRIIVEPGQATCWVEVNVANGDGAVTHKELYTYGPTLREALAEARVVYESIPNRLPEPNALNTARAHDSH